MIYLLAIILVGIYTWGVYMLGNNLEERLDPYNPFKAVKPIKTIVCFYAIVLMLVFLAINLVYLQQEPNKNISIIDKLIESQSFLLN